MDLVDDDLILIMKYLDPISRLKLRMTKRLNRLALCVKNNMDKIKIYVCFSYIIWVWYDYPRCVRLLAIYYTWLHRVVVDAFGPMTSIDY